MTHNTPGSGNDVVTDFVHGQDRLDLRAFDTSFRALKTEDGNGRALGPAAHAFLTRLGRSVDDLEVVPISNSRGERVGELASG